MVSVTERNGWLYIDTGTFRSRIQLDQEPSKPSRSWENRPWLDRLFMVNPRLTPNLFMDNTTVGGHQYGIKPFGINPPTCGRRIPAKPGCP